MAGVALGDIYLVLRGRRGTCGTGLALVARLCALWSPVTCNLKLGKRTLSELRADEFRPTYNIHVLVSSDEQRRALRAKLLYDPVYLRVPVVEDGKASPWKKPAFWEICDAIQLASV